MLFYERLDVMDTNRRVDVDRSKLLAVCNRKRFCKRHKTALLLKLIKNSKARERGNHGL